MMLQVSSISAKAELQTHQTLATTTTPYKAKPEPGCSGTAARQRRS